MAMLNNQRVTKGNQQIGVLDFEIWLDSLAHLSVQCFVEFFDVRLCMVLWSWDDFLSLWIQMHLLKGGFWTGV